MSGRMRGAGPVKFVIRGKLAGKQVEFTRTVDLGKVPNRPWTAALWAQSRIDHLLEEISLDGTKQELKDEVLELALAYNVVTPYTAFLAVPESELGAARDTVMAARERKRKIQLANDQFANDRLAADKSGGGEVITIEGRAPMIDRASTTQSVTVSRQFTLHKPAPGRALSADDGDDDEKAGSKRAAKEVASRDEDGEDMTRSAETVQVGHHGCAGCATGSGNGAASLLLVGLTALVLRRRRCQAHAAGTASEGGATTRERRGTAAPRA